MLHILYGLVCREKFVGDEMCRIFKKLENYWARPINSLYFQSVLSLSRSLHRSLVECELLYQKGHTMLVIRKR